MVTRWIGLGVWAVIVSAILVSAAMAKTAKVPDAATFVFEANGAKITLMSTPCTDLGPGWKKAIYQEPQLTVRGCYFAFPNAYRFAWGDGDMFVLPATAFKPLTAI